MSKVSVGPASWGGLLFSILGVAASVVSAVEHEFPTTGKWCVLATAIIGATTIAIRGVQGAAISHGEAQVQLPSAEEELAAQPEIPESAVVSVAAVDAPPPAA